MVWLDLFHFSLGGGGFQNCALPRVSMEASERTCVEDLVPFTPRGTWSLRAFRWGRGVMPSFTGLLAAKLTPW